VAARGARAGRGSSALFVLLLLIPRHPPVDHSDFTRADMGNLKAAIDALQTVSTLCGMVPLVGENLKSAVEIASAICEKVQVRPSTSEHLSHAVYDGF
jgi:hypothetical protein